LADDPTPDDAPDPGLLEAIEVAARHVGRGHDARETTPVVVRFDAPRPGQMRLWLLTALLLITATGSAYLSFRPQAEPPPEDVEADLRWAVAQVVRRVEVLHSRTGRLPAPEDLHGLVSDMVVYEPLGEGYWVFGQRGPVRVEFDGTIPLARWEKMSLYARGPDTP
jgi:hypothetical protein